MWPWTYSLLEVAGFELAHFVFSFFVVLLVVSPVAFLIWTTYHMRWDDTRRYYLNTGEQTAYIRAVLYMVLLSLSAGLVAHVLEDLFIGWF